MTWIASHPVRQASSTLRITAASSSEVCVLSALSVAVCFDVGGKLVERHRPSGGARGVGGNAAVGHHHLRAAAEVLEFDADLGRRRDAPRACPCPTGDNTLPFSSDMDSV